MQKNEWFLSGCSRFLVIASLLLLNLCHSCKRSKDLVSVKPAIAAASDFSKGADLSWVTEMESVGRKFYNKAGIEMEAFSLLKSLGMNTVRLRLWVNPSPSWNNVDDVIAKALRAKSLGMRIMIDFHYSDSWADPGQQTKPAAWRSFDINGLANAVSTHTSEVLKRLKAAGISPEWVQVGNETNDGMLWPEGRPSASFPNFVKLINSGYGAVKLVFPSAKVIVHISNGYNNELFRWIFDGLTANGAKFDVIGMSLYPTSSNWPALNLECLANMKDMIARYKKEVMVVEVGMNWMEPEATKSFIQDLINKTRSLDGDKGLGVLYWEPEAYKNWKDYSLGAFDSLGKPTAALDAFLP